MHRYVHPSMCRQLMPYVAKLVHQLRRKGRFCKHLRRQVYSEKNPRATNQHCHQIAHLHFLRRFVTGGVKIEHKMLQTTHQQFFQTIAIATAIATAVIVITMIAATLHLLPQMHLCRVLLCQSQILRTTAAPSATPAMTLPQKKQRCHYGQQKQLHCHTMTARLCSLILRLHLCLLL